MGLKDDPTAADTAPDTAKSSANVPTKPPTFSHRIVVPKQTDDGTGKKKHLASGFVHGGSPQAQKQWRKLRMVTKMGFLGKLKGLSKETGGSKESGKDNGNAGGGAGGLLGKLKGLSKDSSTSGGKKTKAESPLLTGLKQQIQEGRENLRKAEEDVARRKLMDNATKSKVVPSIGKNGAGVQVMHRDGFSKPQSNDTDEDRSQSRPRFSPNTDTGTPRARFSPNTPEMQSPRTPRVQSPRIKLVVPASIEQFPECTDYVESQNLRPIFVPPDKNAVSDFRKAVGITDRNAEQNLNVDFRSDFREEGFEIRREPLYQETCLGLCRVLDRQEGLPNNLKLEVKLDEIRQKCQQTAGDILDKASRGEGEEDEDGNVVLTHPSHSIIVEHPQSAALDYDQRITHWFVPHHSGKLFETRSDMFEYSCNWIDHTWNSHIHAWALRRFKLYYQLVAIRMFGKNNRKIQQWLRANGFILSDGSPSDSTGNKTQSQWGNSADIRVLTSATETDLAELDEVCGGLFSRNRKTLKDFDPTKGDTAPTVLSSSIAASRRSLKDENSIPADHLEPRSTVHGISGAFKEKTVLIVGGYWANVALFNQWGWRGLHVVADEDVASTRVFYQGSSDIAEALAEVERQKQIAEEKAAGLSHSHPDSKAHEKIDYSGAPFQTHSPKDKYAHRSPDGGTGTQGLHRASKASNKSMQVSGLTPLLEERRRHEDDPKKIYKASNGNSESYEVLILGCWLNDIHEEAEVVSQEERMNDNGNGDRDDKQTSSPLKKFANFAFAQQILEMLPYLTKGGTLVLYAHSFPDLKTLSLMWHLLRLFGCGNVRVKKTTTHSSGCFFVCQDFPGAESKLCTDFLEILLAIVERGSGQSNQKIQNMDPLQSIPEHLPLPRFLSIKQLCAMVEAFRFDIELIWAKQSEVLRQLYTMILETDPVKSAKLVEDSGSENVGRSIGEGDDDVVGKLRRNRKKAKGWIMKKAIKKAPAPKRQPSQDYIKKSSQPVPRRSSSRVPVAAEKGIGAIVSQQSVIEARWTPDSKIGSGLAFGRGKVGDGIGGRGEGSYLKKKEGRNISNSPKPSPIPSKSSMVSAYSARSEPFFDQTADTTQLDASKDTTTQLDASKDTLNQTQTSGPDTLNQTSILSGTVLSARSNPSASTASAASRNRSQSLSASQMSLTSQGTVLSARSRQSTPGAFGRASVNRLTTPKGKGKGGVGGVTPGSVGSTPKGNGKRASLPGGGLPSGRSPGSISSYSHSIKSPQSSLSRGSSATGRKKSVQIKLTPRHTDEERMTPRTNTDHDDPHGVDHHGHPHDEDGHHPALKDAHPELHHGRNELHEHSEAETESHHSDAPKASKETAGVEGGDGGGGAGAGGVAAGATAGDTKPSEAAGNIDSNAKNVGDSTAAVSTAAVSTAAASTVTTRNRASQVFENARPTKAQMMRHNLNKQKRQDHDAALAKMEMHLGVSLSPSSSRATPKGTPDQSPKGTTDDQSSKSWLDHAHDHVHRALGPLSPRNLGAAKDSKDSKDSKNDSKDSKYPGSPRPLPGSPRASGGTGSQSPRSPRGSQNIANRKNALPTKEHKRPSLRVQRLQRQASKDSKDSKESIEDHDHNPHLPAADAHMQFSKLDHHHHMGPHPDEGKNDRKNDKDRPPTHDKDRPPTPEKWDKFFPQTRVEGEGQHLDRFAENGGLPAGVSVSDFDKSPKRSPRAASRGPGPDVPGVAGGVDDKIGDKGKNISTNLSGAGVIDASKIQDSNKLRGRSRSSQKFRFSPKYRGSDRTPRGSSADPQGNPQPSPRSSNGSAKASPVSPLQLSPGGTIGTSSTKKQGAPSHRVVIPGTSRQLQASVTPNGLFMPGYDRHVERSSWGGKGSPIVVTDEWKHDFGAKSPDADLGVGDTNSSGQPRRRSTGGSLHATLRASSKFHKNKTAASAAKEVGNSNDVSATPRGGPGPITPGRNTPGRSTVSGITPRTPGRSISGSEGIRSVDEMGFAQPTKKSQSRNRNSIATVDEARKKAGTQLRRLSPSAAEIRLTKSGNKNGVADRNSGKKTFLMGSGKKAAERKRKLQCLEKDSIEDGRLRSETVDSAGNLGQSKDSLGNSKGNTNNPRVQASHVFSTGGYQGISPKSSRNSSSGNSRGGSMSRASRGPFFENLSGSGNNFKKTGKPQSIDVDSLSRPTGAHQIRSSIARYNLERVKEEKKEHLKILGWNPDGNKDSNKEQNSKVGSQVGSKLGSQVGSKIVSKTSAGNTTDIDNSVRADSKYGQDGTDQNEADQNQTGPDGADGADGAAAKKKVDPVIAKQQEDFRAKLAEAQAAADIARAAAIEAGIQSEKEEKEKDTKDKANTASKDSAGKSPKVSRGIGIGLAARLKLKAAKVAVSARDRTEKARAEAKEAAEIAARDALAKGKSPEEAKALAKQAVMASKEKMEKEENAKVKETDKAVSKGKVGLRLKEQAAKVKEAAARRAAEKEAFRIQEEKDRETDDEARGGGGGNKLTINPDAKGTKQLEPQNQPVTASAAAPSSTKSDAVNKQVQQNEAENQAAVDRLMESTNQGAGMIDIGGKLRSPQMLTGTNLVLMGSPSSLSPSGSRSQSPNVQDGYFPGDYRPKERPPTVPSPPNLATSKRPSPAERRSDSSPPRNVSKGYTGHEVWTDKEKQWSKGNVVSTFGIAKREEFSAKYVDKDIATIQLDKNGNVTVPKSAVLNMYTPRDQIGGALSERAQQRLIRAADINNRQDSPQEAFPKSTSLGSKGGAWGKEVKDSWRSALPTNMKHDVEIKRDGFDNLIFKPKDPAGNGSAMNSARNGSAMNSARSGDSGKSSPNFLRRRSGMAGGMSPMTPDAPMNTLLRVPNLSRAMSASPPSARSGMSSGNSNWNSPNANGNFGLNRNLSNSPKIGFNVGSPNINSSPKIGNGNGNGNSSNGNGNGNSSQYSLQPQNTTYGSPKPKPDAVNPDAVNKLGISPHLAKVQTGGGVQPHLHLTGLETVGGGISKAKRGLDSPVKKESPNDDPSQRKVPNSPNPPGNFLKRKSGAGAWLNKGIELDYGDDRASLGPGGRRNLDDSTDGSQNVNDYNRGNQNANITESPTLNRLHASPIGKLREAARSISSDKLMNSRNPSNNYPNSAALLNKMNITVRGGQGGAPFGNVNSGYGSGGYDALGTPSSSPRDSPRMPSGGSTPLMSARGAKRPSGGAIGKAQRQLSLDKSLKPQTVLSPSPKLSPKLDLRNGVGPGSKLNFQYVDRQTPFHSERRSGRKSQSQAREDSYDGGIPGGSNYASSGSGSGSPNSRSGSASPNSRYAAYPATPPKMNQNSPKGNNNSNKNNNNSNMNNNNSKNNPNNNPPLGSDKLNILSSRTEGGADDTFDTEGGAGLLISPRTPRDPPFYRDGGGSDRGSTGMSDAPVVQVSSPRMSDEREGGHNVSPSPKSSPKASPKSSPQSKRDAEAHEVSDNNYGNYAHIAHIVDESLRSGSDSDSIDISHLIQEMEMDGEFDLGEEKDGGENDGGNNEEVIENDGGNNEEAIENDGGDAGDAEGEYEGEYEGGKEEGNTNWLESDGVVDESDAENIQDHERNYGDQVDSEVSEAPEEGNHNLQDVDPLSASTVTLTDTVLTVTGFPGRKGMV